MAEPGRSTATSRGACAAGRRARAFIGRHGIVAAVTAALKTTVTELGDSRVRVQVRSRPPRSSAAWSARPRQLGRELKLPGFRRGKVPAPLVIQRIGREAVLDAGGPRLALRLVRARRSRRAGIVPVGDPQLDLADLPARGRGARVLDRDRRAAEGRARRLRGPRGRRAASRPSRSEQIEHEIDGCASACRASRPPSAPPPQGDFVVIDYVGSLRVRRRRTARSAWSRSRAARAATSSSSSAAAT